MHIERILILEDEKNFSDIIASILSDLGYTVDTVTTIQRARDFLQRTPYDLALMDVNLPDGSSIEILRDLSGKKEAPFFISMSGQATLETAIEAMRLGASNYLIKPFTATQLEVALGQLEKWKRLSVETEYHRRRESSNGPTEKIIGNSPATQQLKQLIQQVGPSDATVLIHGESGTGKELVASALVAASSRCNQPYIKLNCTAISENLIESEFFGHEKGAFTGAVSKRIGRFEMAEGGTLLLDEISELPLTLQAKLLRVLQEREFERVGGHHTLRVNVRVLASTNRNLQAFVKEGRFREDLFYRLNVVPINVLPLRHRQEDIGVLLDHFLKYFAHRHGKPIPTLPATTREAICQATWPGNIRELQNCVERAMILHTPTTLLQPSEFGLVEQQETLISSSLFADEDYSLEKMEKRLIEAALRKADGNITKASKLLGISTRTLHYRMAESRDSHGSPKVG